jgi:hypothetical protein
MTLLSGWSPLRFLSPRSLRHSKVAGRGISSEVAIWKISSVVDGRATLVSEIQAESAELSAYVRTGIKVLLGTAEFVDALPGYLLPDAVSQSRTTIILKRLKQLATM